MHSKMLFRLALPANRLTRLPVRRFLCVKSTELAADASNDDMPVTQQGNKILYHSQDKQQFTVRIMLGSACFNLFYWTYHLLQCYLFEGVVLQGVSLGGDPRFEI